MTVNYDRLESDVRHYLSSPESEDIWDKLANSVLMNVVGSLFMLPVALILVCTIIFAKIGILMFWGLLKSFFTLEVFRDQRRKLMDQRDAFQPLITAGIIIGPHGYGLVLGTFSRDAQEDLMTLGHVAKEMAELYSVGGGGEITDEPMVSLLQDDAYRSGRRRMVPRSYSDGRELLLFDMEIDRNAAHFADGVIWIACVATKSEPLEKSAPPRGDIVQIPWRVVSSAVG